MQMVSFEDLLHEMSVYFLGVVMVNLIDISNNYCSHKLSNMELMHFSVAWKL